MEVLCCCFSLSLTPQRSRHISKGILFVFVYIIVVSFEKRERESRIVIFYMEQTLEGSKKNRTIKNEKKKSRRSRRNENLLRLLSHLASVGFQQLLLLFLRRRIFPVLDFTTHEAAADVICHVLLCQDIYFFCIHCLVGSIKTSYRAQFVISRRWTSDKYAVL